MVLKKIFVLLVQMEKQMALDTSKFTAAVADVSAKVDQVVAIVQTAGADEAAAQKALDDGVTALQAASQKLAALAPPTTPAS